MWPALDICGLTIRNPDMIYLLTNVARTQDVPLDGTIFYVQKSSSTTPFSNKKKPDMIYLLTNVAII